MGPLHSLKVLDLTTLLPGPYTTLLLADMGADVLRVEAPHRPDTVRNALPRDDYSSAAHSYLNRNKRSIGLNLKCPAAVDLVKELVREFDIVIEGFRPGVMDRLGIGYEDLKAANPGVILCSITGYGQAGSYRDRAGHDNNYLALSGLASYTGSEAGGPVAAGLQIADVAGGSLHAALGILAAVVHRDKTGEGQAVDVSLTDAAFSLNTLNGANYLVGGVVPTLEGNALTGGGYYGYYETSDGRWISVGSIEPHFLRALCEALGLDASETPVFGQDPDGERQLRHQLQQKIGAMTFDQCCDLFADVDACVEPVLDIGEAAAQPLFEERDMIVDVPTPDGGRQKQIGAAVKFSATRPEYRHIGAAVGEHTEAVLRELGKSDEEITRLAEEGCFS